MKLRKKNLISRKSTDERAVHFVPTFAKTKYHAATHQPFSKIPALKDEEKELITARATRREMKHRQMILQEGFTCKHSSLVFGHSQGGFGGALSLFLLQNRLTIYKYLWVIF
jgi:hypothetical protein